MKLSKLIQGLKLLETRGSLESEITGVNIDSRATEKGHLFIAVKGTQTDGHNYIASAIEKGACAILLEDMPHCMAEGVTYIRVENTESVVGEVATCFYGNPSEKFKLIGVTGTNGKTTIATVLYNMFRHMGHKAGLLSTVMNYIDGQAYPTTHTTPDPITLNRMLARMADAGIEYVFMEVSSHSIVQNRIGGLHFAGGIFTNITRDHLDYHKTFDNYLHAKKQFFDNLPAGAFAITNLDDRNGMVMMQNTKAQVKTYSIQGQAADFRTKIVESHFDGMELDFGHSEFSNHGNSRVAVQFVGRFNASNLLAIYSAAILLGKDAEEVLMTMSAMRPVNGRFEVIMSPDGKTAIVDYAHTPDALENVLRAIHEVLGGKGRVITVCGAGGNRDKGKRPLMAREAVRQSDRVIITSDNPRFENPQSITSDMLNGLDSEQMRKVVTIVDRRTAIKTACMMAEAGDVVLVAGKGHEDYQEIEGVKYHFDDHEEVRNCFFS